MSEIAALSKAQSGAIQWLKDHNGEGVWNLRRQFLAAGEIAPVMAGVWSRLAALGYVEKAGKRMSLTPMGWALPKCEPSKPFKWDEHSFEDAR